MEILDKNDTSDIISWLPNGKTFRIHDAKRLVSEVLPIYFQEISNPTFQAFRRRMKHWQFKERGSFSNESNRTMYYHPLFIKGELDKCLEMSPRRNCRHDISNTNGGTPENVLSYDASSPTSAPSVLQTCEGHGCDEQILPSIEDLTQPTLEEHAMHRHLLEMDQSYQHLYLKSLKEVQTEHLAHLEMQMVVSHVTFAQTMTTASDVRSPSSPPSPSS